MDLILQMSDCIKMVVFCIKFQLFQLSTTRRYWFRWWPGTVLTKNIVWSNGGICNWRIYASLGLNQLTLYLQQMLCDIYITEMRICIYCILLCDRLSAWWNLYGIYMIFSRCNRLKCFIHVWNPISLYIYSYVDANYLFILFIYSLIQTFTSVYIYLSFCPMFHYTHFIVISITCIFLSAISTHLKREPMLYCWLRLTQ